MSNKVNEIPNYKVWNKNTKEFVDCGRSETKAIKIAQEVNGRVWLFFEGVACATIVDKI